MDVLVSINLPSGDGMDYETIVVRHAVADATSQFEALSIALEAAVSEGIDGGLIEGVRLDMGSRARLLSHERPLNGGFDAAATLLRDRQDRENDPHP